MKPKIEYENAVKERINFTVIIVPFTNTAYTLLKSRKLQNLQL